MRLGIHTGSGQLLGGQVHTYLLEKSRVVVFGGGASTAERNFHAFYQLLAGVKEAREAREGVAPTPIS